MIARILTLLCAVCLSCCVPVTPKTRIMGFLDPAYRNHFQTKSILLAYSGMGLTEQKLFQSAFDESFVGYDVKILRILDLLPPTRVSNPQEDMVSKLAQNEGAEAILTITLNNKGLQANYVPPRYHFNISTYPYSGSLLSESVYTTGGYNIVEPWMNCGFALKNAKNHESIWIGEVFSIGSNRSSFDDLVNSIAQQIVQRLAEAKLIASKTKSKPK